MKSNPDEAGSPSIPRLVGFDSAGEVFASEGRTGDYVNNVRMFEATGMGACLLNNEGVNPRDLFRVPDEVVAYTNLADLKKKISGLLSQPDDREPVAISGQSRTLDDYSYKHARYEDGQIH